MKHEFEPVIGLEIHLQLATKSKMFCSCPSGAKTEMAPNTALCPLCSGQPGVLPVINKEAVLMALRAGLGINAKINEVSVFARKNYFYPDLPKGYQISQDDKPIIQYGSVEIETEDGSTKNINITRAHLEEDAGKSTHINDASLIDLNRAGVPLLEIVSEPDMRSPQEAYNYVVALKKIMQWLGVSNCDMEKGELRVDVNISLRPKGAEKFGTRIEIKNLNSFKAVKDALVYEIKRQAEVLDNGGIIKQQTMLWDEAAGITNVMRSKETAQEYRYFPEPDLPQLVVTEQMIDEVKAAMPILPAKKREYYESELALNDYDSKLITSSRQLCDYFEAVVKAGAQPKNAVNWIGTDLLGKLNAAGKEIEESPVKAGDLAALIEYIQSGKISSKMAKDIFIKAFDTGKSIKEVVESSGASQVSDEGALEAWAKEALAANPKAAEDIKAGNGKAIGSLVGAVMKMSQGKANPAVLNKIFMKLING